MTIKHEIFVEDFVILILSLVFISEVSNGIKVTLGIDDFKISFIIKAPARLPDVMSNLR